MEIYLFISAVTLIFFIWELKLSFGPEVFFDSLMKRAENNEVPYVRLSRNLNIMRNQFNWSDDHLYFVLKLCIVADALIFPISIPYFIYNKYFRKDDKKIF